MRKGKTIINSLGYFILFIVLLLSSTSIYSQEKGDEEVKRLQRAIYIYNFAQQVGWPDFETIETFKIGVLGPDRTILDLKSLAQKRTIFGKPIEIIRYQYISEIKDIQLLYVNKKYNYDIYDILKKISEKKILLVSEDYDYNTSMINMVNVGNSYEYEINTRRIEQENLVIASSLKVNAITSAAKWKELYKVSEKKLDEEVQKASEQETLLKEKEKEITEKEEKIVDQLKEIDERDSTVVELLTEGVVQKKRYEEKLLIVKELEDVIQKQVDTINNQENKIKESKTAVDKQLEILETQNKEIDVRNEKIEQQKVILEEQNSKILGQRRALWLLLGLFVSLLLTSFFIYKNYRINKKLNSELARKNKEIRLQSSKLEMQNKEIEQFAYIASHDLQEPLNTITSFINLLDEDYEDKFDDVGKQSLTFIKEGSARMKRLIRSLLDYSQLGKNKEFVSVDCNQLLLDTQANLTTMIEKTNTQIEVGELPVIKGLEVELGLLFQNLINNGIKFMDEGKAPQIKVSCTKKISTDDQEPEFWQFSVQDNGIGIPEKQMDKIFAIFQRLHTKEQYQGTGIGLAHCKKIVEFHGGTIWVESKPCEGSTFFFTIPV